MKPPANIERAPLLASTAPQVVPGQRTRTVPAVEPSWQVVVMDDDVNLMVYVVHVFRKVFGFETEKARRHMLEVHHQGRSVVWTGAREAAEHYVHILQQWHLRAKLETHA